MLYELYEDVTSLEGGGKNIIRCVYVESLIGKGFETFLGGRILDVEILNSRIFSVCFSC